MYDCPNTKYSYTVMNKQVKITFIGKSSRKLISSKIK